MKKIIPAVLIIALAFGGWLWWRHAHKPVGDELVLYGNIDIRELSLAFEGTGRITELSAHEGDPVAAGEVVGRIDTKVLQLQAQAQRAQVEVQTQALLQLRNGARPEELVQANARVSAAKAAALLANQRRERTARLLTSNSPAATQLDMDQANAEAEGAAAQLEQTQSELDQLRAGPRPEAIAAAEAQLQVQRANLDLSNYQITLGELHAPSDAVVRSRLREPGEIVSPVVPVYTLALTHPKWVRVYVREADLGRIKPGMAAQVLTDSQPGKPVAGKVGYISSIAEFTPRSVQTEELRTSLVYEVHVDVDDPTDVLRLGQPVTLKLALGVAP